MSHVHKKGPAEPRHKAHDPLLVNQEEPIGDHEQVSNPNTTVGGYGRKRDRSEEEQTQPRKSNDAPES